MGIWTILPSRSNGVLYGDAMVAQCMDNPLPVARPGQSDLRRPVVPAVASSKCTVAPSWQERYTRPPELVSFDAQLPLASLPAEAAGSKFLQRQLNRCNPGVVELILLEVEQDIAQLMCDAYGNYLCSAAFQACSVRQAWNSCFAGNDWIVADT